jgi:hypothetical protein
MLMEINRRTLLAGGAALAAAPRLVGEAVAEGIAESHLPKGAIILTAVVKAEPGREEAVKKVLVALVEPTLPTLALSAAPPATDSIALSMPRNVQVVNQGGSGEKPLINYQALAWQASSVHSNPVDHYKIYRNGVAYATGTTTTYADSNAPGGNDPTFAKQAMAK